MQYSETMPYAITYVESKYGADELPGRENRLTDTEMFNCYKQGKDKIGEMSVNLVKIISKLVEISSVLYIYINKHKLLFIQYKELYSTS